MLPIERRRSRAYRRSRGREAFVALFLLVTLALIGCRAAFRYPVEEFDPVQSKHQRLVEGMNPFLLTPLFSTRWKIEVDWVEGQEPHPAALEGMQKTLRRFLPEEITLEVIVDDEIPLAEWSAEAVEPRYRSEVLSRWLDFEPEEGVESVYMVYIPDSGEFVGLATEIYVPDAERDGVRVVPTLFIHLNSISDQAFLWITTRKIEEAILVHETGHILGLVSDPDHTARDNPRHCTEPQCVMAHFRGRSQMYNALPAMFAGQIPDSFGNKCRDDIDEVKAYWADAAANHPERLEQARSRRQVDLLRKKACWLGNQERWGEAIPLLQRARTLALDAGLEQDPADEDEAMTFSRCPSFGKSAAD